MRRLIISSFLNRTAQNNTTYWYHIHCCCSTLLQVFCFYLPINGTLNRTEGIFLSLKSSSNCLQRQREREEKGKKGQQQRQIVRPDYRCCFRLRGAKMAAGDSVAWRIYTFVFPFFFLPCLTACARAFSFLLLLLLLFIFF